MFAKTKITIFFTVIALIFSSSTVFADNAEGLDGNSFDVVLVMDNSGSMDDSDPDRLSFMAAQLFVDLCSNSNSRMGYVGFSNRIKDKHPIQEISGNTDFRNLFDKIEIGGGTNIALGLSEAYNLFQSAKKSEYDNKQAVILLCDGDNYPTQTKTRAELDKETKEWAFRLKNAGIEVFTIGFNYDGALNIDFMKSIASDINKFYEAKTADEIPNIMSQIYINLFNGQSKHLGSNAASGSPQSVDVSLSEKMYEADIVFVSNDRPVRNIEILDEHGVKVESCRIVQGRKYSFVRINFPMGGEWKINYTGSPGDRVSVDLMAIYDIPDYASVNVIFETNSEIVIYPQNVKYGKTVSAPQTPNKPSYAFGGWFTDEACKNAFDFNTPVTRDITLYAKWIMETAGVYTVAFDMNGGAFLDPKSVVRNGKVELPAEKDCKKIGYDFAGFFLDKNTTVPFNADAEITDDITLYAKWTVTDVNIAPIILSITAFLIVLIFSTIVFPRLLDIEARKSLSPYVKSIFSIFVNFFLCLAVFVFFESYLIQRVFHYTTASAVLENWIFDNVYVGFFITTGIIMPFLFNLLSAYIFPCATNLMRPYKKKQYFNYFIYSLFGLIFPIVLSILFRIDMRSAVWFTASYFVTYTLNYFFSALPVSSITSKSFSFWG